LTARSRPLSGFATKPSSSSSSLLFATMTERSSAATERVPPELPRRDDLAIPSRAALVDALEYLDRRWETGPFAEPTQSPS
jgi:hypothetical protein